MHTASHQRLDIQLPIRQEETKGFILCGRGRYSGRHDDDILHHEFDVWKADLSPDDLFDNRFNTSFSVADSAHGRRGILGGIVLILMSLPLRERRLTFLIMVEQLTFHGSILRVK